MRFEGRSVLVTGGSRGIGKAIVRMFSAEGAKVAFTYVKSAAEAQALQQECAGKGAQCLAIQADAKDFDAAKACIEKVKEVFGGLDILVNNAGITKDKALMMMAPEEWLDVVNTNLNGTFNFTRNAVITFLKQKSGCVVNISSISGVIGMARQTNYSASKAGIIGFTRALAREVAAYNIRINAVAPGFIETDMVAGMQEAVREKMKGVIPLSRFGSVEDVASAVKFLAGDEARYITGQVLVVDGGLGIR